MFWARGAGAPTVVRPSAAAVPAAMAPPVARAKSSSTWRLPIMEPPPLNAGLAMSGAQGRHGRHPGQHRRHPSPTSSTPRRCLSKGPEVRVPPRTAAAGSFPRVWAWLARIWEVSRVACDGCRLQVDLPDLVATEQRSLVRPLRRARRRRRVAGPPARDRGRRRRWRPRATTVGPLGVFTHGSPAASCGRATSAGLRRGWIRIWHRRLCGPVFVGSHRSGSSLQPRPAAISEVAQAAPGSHPDPATPGQGMVPSVGGLHGWH